MDKCRVLSRVLAGGSAARGPLQERHNLLKYLMKLDSQLGDWTLTPLPLRVTGVNVQSPTIEIKTRTPGTRRGPREKFRGITKKGKLPI